jgi:hypothetical protein
MAKLGSSNCIPLLQRMMLLALLLLASIQAGPVMASDEQVVADLGVVGEKLRDLVGKKAPKMMGNTVLTKLGKKKGRKDFSNGGKAGIKVHKYLCAKHKDGWTSKTLEALTSSTPSPPAMVSAGAATCPGASQLLLLRDERRLRQQCRRLLVPAATCTSSRYWC